MAKFETLIFIPEGSLLNEGVAERNALQQTLRALGGDFGPSERLKYTALEKESKMLGLEDRIDLLLQTFCKQKMEQAQAIFAEQIQKQSHLVKDAIPFLDEVKDEVKLILLAKESKQTITARLQETELLNYFSASYFKEDFTEKLPDKKVLTTVVQKQNLTPASCLVIGTDLVDEIQGAENANLQSLWLAPKKVKMPIAPRPTLHLNKLSDLLFYLELN